MEPLGNKNGLLKPAEAAEYLDVPESTLRYWVHRKEVPFRKAGRHLRFDRAELDNWTKPEKDAA